MASGRISFDGLEEVRQRIADEPRLLGQAVPEMLRAGAAIVIAAQRSQASSMGIRKTGALINSIGVYKEAFTGLSPAVIVAPTGSHAGGLRNAALGAILNYGVKQRAGHPNFRIAARPYMFAANDASEEAVYSAMERIWQNYGSE